MAKFVRVYDPDETERRITLIVSEDNCPGLLSFLAEMPYRTETPLIRGIFHQWFLHHSEAGTLDDAIRCALEGPGGLGSVAKPAEATKRVTPAKARRGRATRAPVPASTGRGSPIARESAMQYREGNTGRSETTAPVVPAPEARLVPEQQSQVEPSAPPTADTPTAPHRGPASPAPSTNVGTVVLPTTIDADAAEMLDSMDSMFAQ